MQLRSTSLFLCMCLYYYLLQRPENETELWLTDKEVGHNAHSYGSISPPTWHLSLQWVNTRAMLSGELTVAALRRGSHWRLKHTLDNRSFILCFVFLMSFSSTWWICEWVKTAGRYYINALTAYEIKNSPGSEQGSSVRFLSHSV